MTEGARQADGVAEQGPAIGGLFVADAAAFLISLLFHLALLVLLGIIPAWLIQTPAIVSLSAPAVRDHQEPEKIVVPDNLRFSDLPSERLGANSLAGTEMALSLAPITADVPDIPSPLDLETLVERPRHEINRALQTPQGIHFDPEMITKGAVGENATGVMGAIDRITHEILLSLEQRKTLVVWLFDQSGSLYRQRQAIHGRLDQIYEELGAIEAAHNPAFKKHEDKPLLASVMAFGQAVTLRTKNPTDDLVQIKRAIREIELDDSGVEKAFSAIYLAAKQHQSYRAPNRSTGEPKRNVMLVLFTDEAGDDQDGLEPAIAFCQRHSVPVFVVGVPAPFGRHETLVKWVDPDPSFDQRPQWGRVTQGPESCFPERIRLHFAGRRENPAPLDSGFGPFGLTRLAYETGGIFFAVHPNRNMHRAVGRRETSAFSAHIERFFDPEVMRRYRPDYVSQKEYARRAAANRARGALLAAAQLSWVTPMKDPTLVFLKRDEASFANSLTEAQKSAAKLAPQVNRLFTILKGGEADRDKEISPRWRAGFDLAYGRVLAVMVRTESYNAMLAKAKRGMKFSDDNNNTWVLEASPDVSVGSQLEKAAEKSRNYLQRVVDDHAGTPWAVLAQRELDTPIGWRWNERATAIAPRRDRMVSGPVRPRPARDDTARMLPRPPPRRDPPAL